MNHPFARPPQGAPLSLEARAKINLRLEVGARRPDGFHEVRTLLHTISLADTVEISAGAVGPAPDYGESTWPASRISVECLPEVRLDGPGNLAHKAAVLYLEAWAAQSRAARDAAVALRIRKVIPVAAGLGGGSADAAAALRGMASLFDEAGAPRGAQLLRLARSLGTDVPFCLAGGAAWGLGRGDRLTPIQGGLCNAALIAMPDTAVSSKDAYSWWDAGPGLEVGSSPARSGVKKGAVRCPTCAQEEGAPSPPYMLEASSILPQVVRNDLRPVVACRVPAVTRLISAMLDSGALASEMSGSGPAVFGVFADPGRAAAAKDRLVPLFPGATFILTSLDPRRSEVPGA